MTLYNCGQFSSVQMLAIIIHELVNIGGYDLVCAPQVCDKHVCVGEEHSLCVEAVYVQYSHLFNYCAFPGFTSTWKQKENVKISRVCILPKTHCRILN